MSFTTEQVDEIAALIEEVLGESKFMSRLHTYKQEQDRKFRSYVEEVKELLGKHMEERKELVEEMRNGAQAHEARLRMLHGGLIKVEARANAIWNTFNALIRFFQHYVTGRYVREQAAQVHWLEQPDYEALFGKLFAWWTPAAFAAAVKAAGKEVFDEAIGHEKAELARMKAQKAAGEEVEPMRPRPENTGDAAFRGVTEVVWDGMQEHQPDREELTRLRQEAAAKEEEKPGEG